jgi:hypothetical protein
MTNSLQGPFWVVELTVNGEHASFLGGEDDGLHFIILFATEPLAKENAAENGHGERQVITLPSPDHLEAFLRRLLTAGFQHVAIDSGGENVHVHPISAILQSPGP